MTLAANWEKLRRREAGKKRYFYVTPALYALYRAFPREAAPFVRGRVLDAGAGFGVWRNVLAARAEAVVSVDLTADRNVDYVGDLKNLPFPDNTYDAAFCAQVLEHESSPAALLRELRRVLKPGGHLILTAPHLSRVHDAPHDYFRFTEYGLRALAADAGFVVAKAVPCGGVLSFIVHNARVFGLAVLSAVPPLLWFALPFAQATSPLVAALDRVIDPRGLFALNWMLVARKDGE